MGFLSGKRLSVLSFALMALACAAAVLVALSGNPVVALDAPPARAGTTPGQSLAAASAAERKGDLTSALAHYRAAVAGNPRLADRMSPEFLGVEFEDKLKAWISGLQGGKIAAGPTGLPDASYLFRLMYGGCG